MHHRDERHVRTTGHRLLQRRRTLGGQLRDQLSGRALEGSSRRRLDPGIIVPGNRGLVHLADEPPLDAHAAVEAERHEGAVRRDELPPCERVTAATS